MRQTRLRLIRQAIRQCGQAVEFHSGERQAQGWACFLPLFHLYNEGRYSRSGYAEPIRITMVAEYPGFVPKRGDRLLIPAGQKNYYVRQCQVVPFQGNPAYLWGVVAGEEGGDEMDGIL